MVLKIGHLAPGGKLWLATALNEFTTQMLYKLNINGNRQEWEKADFQAMQRRLHDEVAELDLAIATESRARVRDEAADVANCALMIHEIMGRGL
jgi:hypothetical protein